MKLTVSPGGNRVIVPSGVHKARLEEVQIGRFLSKYHPDGSITVRFVFVITEGVAEGARLSHLVGLQMSNTGIRFNERAKFWKTLSALTNSPLNEAFARAIEVDIPEINSIDELPFLNESAVKVSITVRGKDIIGSIVGLVVTTERRNGRDFAIIRDVFPMTSM